MELDDSTVSRWCLDTARAVAEGHGPSDLLEQIEAWLGVPRERPQRWVKRPMLYSHTQNPGR